MKIVIENIGKRFNKEWIFRNLNYEFTSGNKYAILGTNGCGKSTLLQIIAGASSQTEGRLTLTLSEGEGISSPTEEGLFRDLSFAAPYLELPEEMTWTEAVMFHAKFKKFVSGFSEEKIITLSGLESSAEKEIRNFSSGMKQRLRLALAVCSDTPVLLLDEPATNLDVQGIEWYKDLIGEFAANRLVIIASNDPHDAAFCPLHLNIMDYK